MHAAAAGHEVVQRAARESWAQCRCELSHKARPALSWALPCHRTAPVHAQGSAVAILARYLGIYVGFADEPVPENVKKWNVKTFQLQRSNRHRDRSVVQDLYGAIDRHLKAKKSALRY